jgi:hypothetical protein
VFWYWTYVHLDAYPDQVSLALLYTAINAKQPPPFTFPASARHELAGVLKSTPIPPIFIAPPGNFQDVLAIFADILISRNPRNKIINFL